MICLPLVGRGPYELDALKYSSSITLKIEKVICLNTQDCVPSLRFSALSLLVT